MNYNDAEHCKYTKPIKLSSCFIMFLALLPYSNYSLVNIKVLAASLTSGNPTLNLNKNYLHMVNQILHKSDKSPPTVYFDKFSSLGINP